MSIARISRSKSCVKSAPELQAESTNELLFGESVEVLEEVSGQPGQWFRIKSLHDSYEGFIQSITCELTAISTTHRVIAKATLVFEQPDIKSVVVQRLLFGSELALRVDTTGNAGADQKATNNSMITEYKEADKFLKLHNGGFVWAEHCQPKTVSTDKSMVDLVEGHYLHAPYLWGGRSTDGCDCSGLVQMIAMAKGVTLPRDSGDQEVAIESEVDYADRAAEHLVYWPGHVGILKSANELVHSTAHSLQCCIEPLSAVIERAGFPSSIKRIL